MCSGYAFASINIHEHSPNLLVCSEGPNRLRGWSNLVYMWRHCSHLYFFGRALETNDTVPGFGYPFSSVTMPNNTGEYVSLLFFKISCSVPTCPCPWNRQDQLGLCQCCYEPRCGHDHINSNEVFGSLNMSIVAQPGSCSPPHVSGWEWVSITPVIYCTIKK